MPHLFPLTPFQILALALTIVWFALVVVRFRRSTVILIVGLFALAGCTAVALILGKVTWADLGLAAPRSWLWTVVLALVWLGLMLAYSPLADRIASRWFPKPPTLEAFRPIQHSAVNLIAGLLVAWILGGVLEELIARGIVLNSFEALMAGWLPLPLAAGLALCLAAVGAGFMHFYQGPRAVVIIAQLSVLFGLLFVVSGNNLWAVMLCHGLYDTVAFIRFAVGKSRYSQTDPA